MIAKGMQCDSRKAKREHAIKKRKNSPAKGQRKAVWMKGSGVKKEVRSDERLQQVVLGMAR